MAQLLKELTSGLRQLVSGPIQLISVLRRLVNDLVSLSVVIVLAKSNDHYSSDSRSSSHIRGSGW